MTYPDFSGKSIPELISLTGRTAVVTGAGAGLGRAIAMRLAEAGATVLAADIDEVSAATTAKALSSKDARGHIGTRVEVRDHSSITALADLAIHATKRLDIWVNNAGIYPFTRALDVRDDEWDRVLEVNLRGSFLGAREAALRMEPGRGVIINLASTAGFTSTHGVNSSHYIASKHAVVGLIKSLAVEFGPKGLRVVGVAPTMTETKGVAQIRAQGAQANSELDAFARTLPLGRSGVADDVARVVLFLASDLAAFVTGSVVAADGGELAC